MKTLEPRDTTGSAVGMGAAAAASRLLGFVRFLVVAAVLGTTYLGNAFQSANSVSNVLFELLAAGALSAVLVPVFVELLDRNDTNEAERVAGSVLGAALLVLGAVAVGGVVAAPVLARALTAGVPAAVADDQRELVTFLLRFFVPQVLLYAAGTVATAVLHARRRFVVAAVAPVGNTVVMVACLLAFRALAGSDPTFDLTSAERTLLIVAGSGGVAAFVGVLLVACASTGFRLRPRFPRRDAGVVAALRHSAWGVALHSGSGLLLGGAIVAGAAVEGGVVAYQVAWVFFLTPYGVLAQPIHTTILPELVAESDRPQLFAASLRWAIERMAVLVLPIAAGGAAVAGVALRAVTVGETGPEGADLVAAGLVTLLLGLFPYGAFLLLARGFYALGDSRSPAVAAIVTALAGVSVMCFGAVTTHGDARVAMLGAGHSVAFALGAVWLGLTLRRRLGVAIAPRALGRTVAVAVAAGLVAWLVASGIGGSDPTRGRAAVAAVVALAAGAVVVGAAYRALRLPSSLSARGA